MSEHSRRGERQAKKPFAGRIIEMRSGLERFTRVCSVCKWTHSLVEHAGLAVLVFAVGTVDESVAEHVVVDASVASHAVGRGTREALHAVLSGRTLCKRGGDTPKGCLR